MNRYRNNRTLAGPGQQFYPYGGNIEPMGHNFEGNPRGYYGDALGMPNFSADRITGDEYHGYSDEGRNSRRMDGMHYAARERRGFENFDYMEPGYNDYGARGASQESFGHYWKESGIEPTPMDMRHGYYGPHNAPRPHQYYDNHPRHWRPMNENRQPGPPMQRPFHDSPPQGYGPQGMGYYEDRGWETFGGHNPYGQYPHFQHRPHGRNRH